ncbi:MAG: hypothetical protein K8U57_36155 [Planctomycetes bacterium]|nr:hypothetical protein [Planctomycetota bacterium]
MKKREDQAFLDWIKRQPSAISGQFSEYHDSGEAFSIPCHVRRARDAGTGYKPLYSAIPLTDAEHKFQSQHGEIACLIHYGVLRARATVEEAKAWFNEQAEFYRWRWVQRSNTKSSVEI